MEASLRRVPIFPLTNVVLFPRVRTPLHVFEPRYRQMTESALAGDRRIVMAVVLPDHAGDVASDPPVYDVACSGVISEARRLPDGRFYLLLDGDYRVRIVEEVARPPGQLFRSANVRRLADPYPPAAAGEIATMRARLSTLVGEVIADDESPDPLGAVRDIDDASFVNALANALPLSVAEKQGLIEADGIPERYSRLIEILEFARAERLTRRVPNSSVLH